MQIKSKQVAIVSFVRDFKNAQMLESLGHPTPRVISYQVTLDPARISPSGEFIRFGVGGDSSDATGHGTGKGGGDEITGWILLEDLSIDEILAEHDGEAFRPAVQSAQRAA